MSSSEMVWDEIRGRVMPDTCVKEAKPATVGRLTPGLRALHARAALAGLKALSTASTETILWGWWGRFLPRSVDTHSSALCLGIFCTAGVPTPSLNTPALREPGPPHSSSNLLSLCSLLSQQTLTYPCKTAQPPF